MKNLPFVPITFNQADKRLRDSKQLIQPKGAETTTPALSIFEEAIFHQN